MHIQLKEKQIITYVYVISIFFMKRSFYACKVRVSGAFILSNVEKVLKAMYYDLIILEKLGKVLSILCVIYDHQSDVILCSFCNVSVSNTETI